MANQTLVKTLRFGDLQVPEEERIRLLRPLAGFPDTHHLVKLLIPGQAPFCWLQSLEQAPVAFAAVPVDQIVEGYSLKLPPWDKGLWARGGAPEILALLSFQGEATANLAAPLLFDAKRGVALQVLNQGGFSLRQPLFTQAPAAVAAAGAA
jgi:flagellar assembly factor FliW